MECVELLLAATPFEDSASSVERRLKSEIAKELCDASGGLEPRRRLTELPCSEIKEVSDVFGENPKDRVPESFSGNGDFGGGVGYYIRKSQINSRKETLGIRAHWNI